MMISPSFFMLVPILLPAAHAPIALNADQGPALTAACPSKRFVDAISLRGRHIKDNGAGSLVGIKLGNA